MTTKQKILLSVCVTTAVLAAALIVLFAGNALLLRRNTQKVPIHSEDFSQHPFFKYRLVRRNPH